MKAMKDGRFSISSLGFSTLCRSRCNCNVTLGGLCVGEPGGLPPERGHQSEYQLMTAGETGPKGLQSACLPIGWACQLKLWVNAQCRRRQITLSLPALEPFYAHFLPVNLQIAGKNEVRLLCKFLMMWSQIVPSCFIFFNRHWGRSLLLSAHLEHFQFR